MGLLRDRLEKERAKVNDDFDKETKAPFTRRGTIRAYLDLTKIGIDIPTYIMKDEKQKIDILMWEAGNQHPVKKKGQLAWKMVIAIHKNIGPMLEDVICPFHTYGEPCPICEYIKSNRLPKNLWKMYREQDRLIQLIWPHTTPEFEKRKVHLWDVSAFQFDGEIKEQAIMPEDGGTIQYADPEFGQTLYFKRKEEGTYLKPDGTQGKGVNYSGFRFAPRAMPVPDSIADMALQIPLDDALVILSYEELDELFRQTSLLFKPQTGGLNSGVPSSTGTYEALPTVTPQAGKCPANGEYGKDTNRLPECGDCVIYDDCKAEKDAKSAPAPSTTAQQEPAPEKKEDKPAESSEDKPPQRKLLRRKSQDENSDVPY